MDGVMRGHIERSREVIDEMEQSSGDMQTSVTFAQPETSRWRRCMREVSAWGSSRLRNVRCACVHADDIRCGKITEKRRTAAIQIPSAF
jgi:hypothetical protein